jgi:biopolymer transport protein ExbD
MNSPATNTPKQSSHCALCIAVVLAAVLFAPRTNHAQQLQQGVSVQLAVTSNAVPMPDADNQDAWIVAVPAGGNLYFGIDPVSPSELADQMKSRPRRRDQKLYIKADARAPFADVRRVFAAAHELGFDTPVLLTSQKESPAVGTVTPPTGLDVTVGPLSQTAPVVVQINSGRHGPTVLVNDQQIPDAPLMDTLRHLVQERRDTPVLVKASGTVPFAAVVRVIDICRSIGAKVAFVTPML